MPANLSPEFQMAEKKYKAAKDNQEKLIFLQEMLSSIPKHKGTEKMQADLKTRISRLRKELSKGGSKKKGGPSHNVPREGEAQVFLVGGTNVGKSKIVETLTKAKVQVGDYPYTTKFPSSGMMLYEDIKIQLVDMPPLTKEFVESWYTSVIRTGDSIIVVVDANDDFSDDLKFIKDYLNKSNIFLSKDNIIARNDGFSITFPHIILANKVDEQEQLENLNIVKEFINEQVELFPFSYKNPPYVEALKEKIFTLNSLVRVYTKERGKRADLQAPVVLRSGDTVLDFARTLHKDFAEKIKYARIWGKDKYDGQKVNKNYILKDKDVIEIHI